MALYKNKNLKLYYSISEVADMFQVTEATLRNWEHAFPKTIHPKKAGRNIRQYTAEDLEDVRLIHHLVREKQMSYDGVRQVLKDNPTATIKYMEVIDRLKALREELMAIKQELDDHVVY